MALTRESKEQLIGSYQSDIGGAPHAFIVGFTGISVSQVEDLRGRVRDNGGSYSVVKNRLAIRAFEGTAFEELSTHFVGPTAVAYSHDDPVGLAKALTDFAKEHPVVEFKAGLVDGQAVEASDIQDIASMPSREDLVAKLVFLLQSPIARFVRGLGAIPQQFVSVLDQVSKQKTD